jgi:hypothetical protein
LIELCENIISKEEHTTINIVEKARLIFSLFCFKELENLIWYFMFLSTSVVQKI